MIRAVLIGAAAGVGLTALVTFAPTWVQGTGYYEWSDSFLGMGLLLVPLGAALGALWQRRRRHEQV